MVKSYSTSGTTINLDKKGIKMFFVVVAMFDEKIIVYKNLRNSKIFLLSKLHA